VKVSEPTLLSPSSSTPLFAGLRKTLEKKGSTLTMDQRGDDNNDQDAGSDHSPSGLSPSPLMPSPVRTTASELQSPAGAGGPLANKPENGKSKHQQKFTLPTEMRENLFAVRLRCFSASNTYTADHRCVSFVFLSCA